MALDEALLLARDAPPTLRLYTWSPAALSLGYFQRFADVPAAARAGALVRRATGGGAIWHERELTFSVAADAAHPLYAGPIADSYERVHAAVADALRPLGVDATLRGERSLRSDRADTGMCFHVSTPLDLVWDERKGVGSAQRRTGGRVLHHGSIKLDATELEPGVARLPAGTALETVAELVLLAFARRFDAGLEPAEPSASERAHAERRAAWFESDAFVRRR